jgi:hypothetical protein
MVRDYLFLRQTQVAKYFNRTLSVTGRLHSPLVVSVAQVPAIASLHARSVFISAVPPTFHISAVPFRPAFAVMGDFSERNPHSTTFIQPIVAARRLAATIW